MNLYIKKIAFIFGLSLVLISTSYAESAGKILFSYGRVIISKQDKGKNLPGIRGLEIQPGDIVKTFDGSMTQIKLSDNTLIALKPNSQWSIKQYKYNTKNPSLSKQSSELIKGGLRAVSGLVGKANPKNVEYAAGTTTIGIRGTIFEVLKNPENRPQGVYVKVDDGAVEISNSKHQTLWLRANEAGAILSDAKPIRLDNKDVFVSMEDAVYGTDEKSTKTMQSNETAEGMDDATTEIQQDLSPEIEVNLPIENMVEVKDNKEYIKNEPVYNYINYLKLKENDDIQDFNFISTQTEPDFSQYNDDNNAIELQRFVEGKGGYKFLGYKNGDTKYMFGYTYTPSDISFDINASNEEFIYVSEINKDKFYSTSTNTGNNAEAKRLELKLNFASKKLSGNLFFQFKETNQSKFYKTGGYGQIDNAGNFIIKFSQVSNISGQTVGIKLYGDNNIAKGNFIANDYGVANFHIFVGPSQYYYETDKSHIFGVAEFKKFTNP